VLAAGMDDFLHKPFERREIFECLARHLGVRYSYRQVEPARPTDSVPLPGADLATLPKALRNDLADAVIHLDPQRIREVINRVTEHDARLGDVLSRSAERLAYSTILQALDDCASRAGGAAARQEPN
jgi:DNA-binding response OmpR family regulator